MPEIKKWALERPHRPKWDHEGDLPRETGVVSSLRESYGFIECAERYEEIFFHFSDVVQRSDLPKLRLGQEVEFTYGYSSNVSNEGKPAAYRVTLLPVGSVQWESVWPERVVGVVERPARPNNSGSAHGTILIEDNGTPYHVKFTLEDFKPTRTQSNKLHKGDTVEFTLVTHNRTKTAFAREISLKHSLKHQKLQKLLADAPTQQGVIVTLKDDYGFLRSNKRRDQVYFHFSNLHPDHTPDQLTIGQHVQFLLVNEQTDIARPPKLSAHQLQFLPAGTVLFEEIIATGVLGTVLTPPTPTKPKSSQKHPPPKHNPKYLGEVGLHTPIPIDDTQTLTQVLFYPEDSPGGTISHGRDGSVLTLWVRQGDVLLFDVVKNLVDDSYCINPTASLSPFDETHHEEKAVRLIQPSLPGRAEGVVSILKDGFGFVTLAERNVDVYFRFTEVFPLSVQNDILTNLYHLPSDQLSSIPNQVFIGAEVSFDLSSSSVKPPSKESLKAQRLLILPLGSVLLQKTLGVDLHAVVTQERNDGSGFLELEEPLKGMTMEERHPYVTRMLDSYKELAVYDEDVTYREVQSAAEAKVVAVMAEARGFEVSYVTPDGTVEAADSGGARIRLSLPPPPSPHQSEPEPTTDNHRPEPYQTPKEPPPETTSEITPRRPKKKRPKKPKPVKLIRFDKITLPGGPLGIGDIVTCDVVQYRRTGAYAAIRCKVLQRCQRGDLRGKNSNIKCLGIILMEPSHSSLSSVNKTASGDAYNGYILLLQDPGFLFRPKIKPNSTISETPTETSTENGSKNHCSEELPIRLVYHNENIRENRPPHRGDLVSFTKGKGSRTPKDIRLVQTSAATKISGNLEEIDLEKNTALFKTSEDRKEYVVDLGKVLGCGLKALREKVAVEGILHDNKIHGVCRRTDLYLESKVSHRGRERPRLNLTVKKQTGGKIIAQSCMAKGPDGTIGFHPGWTKRISLFAVKCKEADTTKECTSEKDSST